jgi:hypothetical protein
MRGAPGVQQPDQAEDSDDPRSVRSSRTPAPNLPTLNSAAPENANNTTVRMIKEGWKSGKSATTEHREPEAGERPADI